MQTKNIGKLILILAVFKFCVAPVFAQNVDICRKSTEGTDFWFGFMESRNYIISHEVRIIVTARETTTFTIAVGKMENSFNGNFTVFADSSIQVSIPWKMVESVGSEVTQDKGIHLLSQKPVNVYAISWDHYSSDVAVIYPVEALGNEYYAMCYYPNIDPRNPESGSGRNSEFLIVAVEDQTLVEITPSKVTDKLMPKDSTFTIHLNKGEVFQVQSENGEGTDKSGQGDLTGSYVQANKPIAFYSGALGTTVPYGKCCWDHLYEQIPPIHSWGREYFTVPLKSREKDIYRILAAEDNTVIQITGQAIFNLNGGEFYEMQLSKNDVRKINSDKPILVSQFSLSHDTDSTETGGNGDPFMLILNSTEQWISNANIVNIESNLDEADTTYFGIKKHFVNLVALTNEVPGIVMDGQSVQNEFKPLPGMQYSYAQIETGPGNHRIENVNGENGFLAYVYGFGKWESYGYGAGFNVNLNLDLRENIEFFKGDTLLLCNGDTIKFDAGSQFDSFRWSTGEVTQKINVTNQGIVWVEATTNDGCKMRDTVFVFKSSPEIDIGDRSDSRCHPYSVTLNGGTGFEKYIWQNEFNDTLSTNSHYLADKTGEYRLTVYNNYRCAARDTFSLTVYPVPEIEIFGDHLVCGFDTTTLSLSINGTADSIWNFPGSFSWLPNSTDLILSDKEQKYVKTEALKKGNYEIYYKLKTIDNCETADTFKIRFHPQPVSGFNFEDDAECEGYSKKLIFTGTATDSAFFNWDLDGCQFVDTIDSRNRIYNISVGAFLNEQPNISLVIDDNGCISDTTVKILSAKPNFIMKADKLRGCDVLNVNFSSELLTADKVDFSWTFDDMDKVNLQNVSRFYADTGFYKVNLTITNPVTNCRNSFTIDSMIKVFPTPVAEISADPVFCYPDSVLIFYTNNIDSSFCTWDLSGISKWGNGNDSINIVFEQPVGNVKLTVNEFGCISEPAEMQLKRKPVFDFNTENEEGCQPYSVVIFAETEDNYVDFTWLTDSLPYPKGNSNLYYLVDTGRYDISLIAYSSETGCADTLLKPDWIWVHRNPYAKFEVDYQVALIDNSKISFINYSERASDYYWDFGDSITSIEFEPVHTYTGLGDYTARLMAESGFGCADTFDLVIRIIPSTVYSPNAFRPDSEIPENRTFMPVSAGVDESRFNLKIFNRWGELIFETNSTMNPWDGKLKNGGGAPIGNYVWISNYFDIQGFEHNEKGQVLLIR